MIKSVALILFIQPRYLNKKKRFALLDTLLEAQRTGNQIDDAGIQEEVDTFVFTGFDTVSVALINALMVIANHPEHQQRLYEEISQALGKCPFLYEF